METGLDNRFSSVQSIIDKLTPFGYQLFGIYEQTPHWTGKQNLWYWNTLFANEEILGEGLFDKLLHLHRTIRLRIYRLYSAPLLSMCKKGNCTVSVVIETRKATGVLGNSLSQSNFGELNQKIEALQKKSHFNIIRTTYDNKRVKQANKLQFGRCFSETHCFRGYPVYGSFKQFFETDSKYLLHLIPT